MTAVALPLPHPGPIEPAPTTTAILPLSRSIELSQLASRRAAIGSGLAGAHYRGVGAERMTKYLRQRPTLSSTAQAPFPGRAGITEQELWDWRTPGLPLKPAIEQPRLRWRLHASARTLHARLHQLQARCRYAPVFLPFDFFNRMRPRQRESRNRQRLEDASRCEAKAQAGAIAVRERCRHCQSTIAAVSRKPDVSLRGKSPSRHSAAASEMPRSRNERRVKRKPMATMPN